MNSDYENNETENKTGNGLEVAIIGMAGRFPGAKNIDELWENLKNGKESITFFSDDELKEAGAPAELLQNPNYVKANGILDGFDRFDASFFGYIPAEAAVMAPQVRLFHECVWEGLENAGYMPETNKGRIGLYAGASSSSRWEAMAYLSSLGKDEKGEPDFLSFAEGFSNSQLADKDNLTTRISYKFNLTGPSFLVQTACSTSLVAVHLAVQGLLNGECEMAVAGGTAVTITRRAGYLYQEGAILSPDGHNRTFDARAKGTVAGDGAGVVVLKLLEDAEADGDYIHAVIKGSAINNDGFRKVGYTAPSTEGQAQVIITAQYVAEVEPGSITYVEAHGTATELGDPVEVEALKLAFGNTAKKESCALGSVKSNIGHLNAAAGIAGFIKTVLALKYGMIPPSLHYETPNPKIDFENSPFYVNTKLKEWKCEGYPRRAGVSSFGIGGTNAHVVLEEYIKRMAVQKEEGAALILLSARTENTLEKATENIFLYFKNNPGASPQNAAYTLQVGRKHFSHRRTVVCSNTEELLDALAPENRFKTRTYTLTTRLGKKRPVVFLFPGQGAQYISMGLALHRNEPLFRQEMDRCFKILNPLMGVDVKEILYPSTGDYRNNIIDQTEIAQPLIFAFEYALASLLMSWGIEPAAMVGHSIGEYTAACLAGVFSLEDALQLVALRGRLMQQMPAGAMLSVAMPEEQLKPLLTDDISLAAVNSPSRCVVSGPGDAIAAFEVEVKARGIESTRLHTSHAFHSRMMDPILEPFREKVGATRMNKPAKPYISNVSGRWVAADEAVDPAYWTRHLRQTVRFSDGVKLLLANDDFVFIEVGPGNSLTTLVKQHDGTAVPAVVNLVRRPQEETPDDRYLSDKIGQLWLYSIAIDWAGFHRGGKRYRVPLPTYPFESRRFPIADNLLQKASTAISGRHVEVLTRQTSRQETNAAMSVGETMAETTGPDTFSPRPGLSVEYEAPRDLLEQALVDIWQPYFGFQKIGIHDNFFELGGDSLKGMMLVNQYKKVLGEAVLVAIIFNAPTIAELADYFTKHYPLAAARIRQGDAAKSDQENNYISIQPVEKKEYYTLSSAQKRLYILQQMDAGGTSYHVPYVCVLEGELDIMRLDTVFRKLIRRHDSLRTSFIVVNEEPVQRIDAEVEFKIEILGSRDQESHGAKISAFIRSFDFSCAPLMRVGLIKEAETRHILAVDIHHIVTDGASMELLIKEFKLFYIGKELSLLQVQYKDYAGWQNWGEQKEAIRQQEIYWLEQFSDEIPVLELPTDFPRPVVQSFEGHSLRFEIAALEMAGLKKMAALEGATLYMVLLSITTIFFSKLSNQEDIIIGAPTAGRRHADLEKIIGMFVNTLALRNFPVGEKRFTDFLGEVKARTLSAFENQDYQFEDMVEQILINRDVGRNPLFDVVFVLQNLNVQPKSIPDINIPGLMVRPYEHELLTAKFDITLSCFEGHDGLIFRVEYGAKLFKEETIKRFIDYYKNIISAVLANPGGKIADIEIMTEEEKRQILDEFNGTEASYPADKTIQLIFEDQVKKTPDHIALVEAVHCGCPADVRPVPGKNQLSYRQLNENAGRLAHLLNEKGVLMDTIVGIMRERSIDMIIGILGILKSGGAYLPIDPEYPRERIDYMLKDSNVKILINQSEIRNPKFETNPNDQKINVQNKNFEDLLVLSFENLNFEFVSNFDIRASNFNSSNLAYIIYTSGTTGMPKGCMITHQNVLSLLKNKTLPFEFNENDSWTMFHQYNFDFSVWEMYGALLYGGRLTLIPKKATKDLEQYLEILKQEQITVLNITPSVFYQLSEIEKYSEARGLNLKYVIFGGEALHPAKLKKWREKYPGTKLINMFGITETTVHVTYKEIGDTEIQSNISNIGKPLSTLAVCVVDRYLNLLPGGIPGELCVRGEGVARGYLNRPELTAEKFITHYSALLYRSGDLVKILNNGEMEYMGRIDQQVKIRGFRIELGEIENRLLMHGAVKEAAVVCRESGHGDKYLCAYITATGKTFEKDFFSIELKKYLSRVLPDYMLPSYFVLMDRIPLTSNGKVDRKALPKPEVKVDSDYTAPCDQAEAILAETWAEVLEIDKDTIGRDANFFDLGGHSLKAVSLIARIEKKLHAKISLAAVFTNPTIREMAKHITPVDKYHSRCIEVVEEKEYYPLTPMQKKFFILNQLQTMQTAYNISSVLVVQGTLDREKLKEAFSMIIHRHATLRTSFIMVDKEPVQRVHRDADFELEYNTLAGAQTEVEYIKRFIRPFDLSRAPLLRAGLLKISEGKHILMFDMHHIVSDGTSVGILIRDMVNFYEGKELPLLPIQYKDFSQWFNSPRGEEAIAAQEAYWLGQFKGKLPVSNMYTDYPRPPIQSFTGDNITFSMGEELTLKIKRLMPETGTTLFMVLLAGLNILLSAYTGQEDIVVGAPIAGRINDEFKDIIALFINALPTRNFPRKDKTFSRFLAEVKENTINAYENQLYPFAALLEKLNIQKDLSRNPLFDVELVVLNMEIPTLEIEGLRFRPYDYKWGVSQLDIDLYVSETEKDIWVNLIYCTEIFKKETMEGFIAFYKEILSTVSDNKEIKLHDIRMPHNLAAAQSSGIEDDCDGFGF